MVRGKIIRRYKTMLTVFFSFKFAGNNYLFRSVKHTLAINIILQLLYRWISVYYRKHKV